MKATGIVVLAIVLSGLPLAHAQTPPAQPSPPASAPAPAPQEEGFTVVHVELRQGSEDRSHDHDQDLCVQSTGSRVLGPKPGGSGARCAGHGWSFGSSEVPSDGDMGSALQQLSPVIR